MKMNTLLMIRAIHRSNRYFVSVSDDLLNNVAGSISSSCIQDKILLLKKYSDEFQIEEVYIKEFVENRQAHEINDSPCLLPSA